MSIEQPDNLVKIGKLKAEQPEAAELDGLLRSGRLRLDDAGRTQLSFESRFDLAYNAAHAFALAALRLRGYRSENRYLVFQALQHTVGLPPAEWRVLDRAHTVRNRAEYEGYLDEDMKLLEGVLVIAKGVEARVAMLREERG